MKKISAVLVVIAATLPPGAFAAQTPDAPIVIRSAPMRMQPMIISGNVGPSVPDPDSADDAVDSGNGNDDRTLESRHSRHAERRHADFRHRPHRASVGNNGHAGNRASMKLPEFASTPIHTWVSRGLEDLRASPSDDARVVYTAIDGEAMDVVGQVAGSDWYAVSRETGIAFVRISSPPPLPVASSLPVVVPSPVAVAPAGNVDATDQIVQPGVGTAAPESSGCLVSLGGNGRTAKAPSRNGG